MKEDDEIEVIFGIIPCYFNIETQELRGKNRFYQFILSVYFWIEIKLGYVKIKDDD